jgi:starch synthase (maltosyl-transferring)
VQRAHRVGLEVALELTWTVAPGHPWLEQHAGWFVPTGDDTWRLDPDAEPAGVLGLVLETLVGWADRGVGAFVVRDAHHWPLGLWEHVLRELAAAAPDVLLLSEGDASPAQAHALALVGFHQTTPALHDALGLADVEDVLAGVGRGSVTRTHLVAAPGGGRASTLDDGGAATRCAWAAVAALGSPAWETSSTLEEVDGPSSEPEPDVATFLGRLNELRRAHPALRRRRGLVLHRVHHAGVLAFSRSDGEDALLVVVDLFPAFPKSVGVPDALGAPGERLQDELDGTWHTLDALTLDPAHPVRVLTARR